VRVYVVSRFRNTFGILGVDFTDSGAEISKVVEIIEGRGVRIRSTDTEIEDGRAGYELQLRIPPGRPVQEMLAEISALSSVSRVQITGLQEVE
jgi:acetolactate synthase regulatory subunit